MRSDQERRVAEVIRSAAGELSDLVEDNLAKDKGLTSTPPKEELSGLTSGPGVAPDAKREPKEESEETGESSEEEVEDLEESAEESKEKEKDASRDPARREESGRRAPPSPINAEGAKGDRGLEEPPAELGRHLELYPAPKRSTKVSRGETSLVRHGPQKRRNYEEDRCDHHPAARSSGARRGDHEEDSQGRDPLPRRRQQPGRPRSRGTKGAKKKQRAQEFRRKKIEERRQQKAERWVQKQKQNQDQRRRRGNTR